MVDWNYNDNDDNDDDGDDGCDGDGALNITTTRSPSFRNDEQWTRYNTK